MSQPGIIVYSTADVSNIPMTDDNNTFTGTNTFNIINGTIGTITNFKSGGHRITVATKTSGYTVSATDELVVCNSTSAFTVTLPAATGGGQLYEIKNINSGAITVDGNGSDTIDGITTQTLGQWDALTITDYAANAWTII